MPMSLIPTFESKSSLDLLLRPDKNRGQITNRAFVRRRTKLKGNRKRDVRATKTDEEKSRLVRGETFVVVKYATVKIMPARTVYCVTWA